MCGRFVGAFSTDRLLREISEDRDGHGITVSGGSDPLMSQWAPDYNVAPTRPARVLVGGDGSATLEPLPWGIRARWASGKGQPQLLINARSETVAEKPSFRGMVGPWRCIVPMDGFYEWQRTTGEKRPFFCERVDGSIMLVAGIWTGPSTQDQQSGFCILTRPSGPDLDAIHDRCPVHLDVEGAQVWLDADEPPLELCSPDAQPLLACRAVSKKVNSVRNNGPGLLDSGGEDDIQPSLF